jgi:hypothetical protein
VKRYSPRTTADIRARERLLLFLKERADKFTPFFADNLDDSQQPDDLWAAVFQFLSTGDFYLEFDPETCDITKAIYIYDRAGTRHGGILMFGAAPEDISAAVGDAFGRSSYHKIKADAVDPSPFVDAGFIVTGDSPADLLLQGNWVPIIHLEITNPEWQGDPGGNIQLCSRRAPRVQRWLRDDAAVWLRRVWRWFRRA